MDGACKSAMKIIKKRYPHIQVFSCPSHAIDLFLKNVGSDQPTINMQSNQLSGVETQHVEWGITFFSDTFDNVWFVVKFVTNHHKPLARYRALVKALPIGHALRQQGNELLKYGETRFASKVMMARRMLSCRELYEALLTDNDYKAWLEKQSSEVKETAQEVKDIINDRHFWATLDVVVRTLNVAVTTLRISNGMSGGVLGKLFDLCLQLDTLYAVPIEGLDDDVREKVHQIWCARWKSFHVPVMSAAYMLHPEFCRRDWSQMPEQRLDLTKVMKEMATEQHMYAKIRTQYTAFRNACEEQSHDLNDNQAFSAASLSVPPHHWIETWMEPWPDLMWFALRVVCIPCSASAAEHSWSIEGWIHSKHRNRLGQKLVERLVRAHMNMAVDRALDEAIKKLLPWDIELVIDEPMGPPEDTVEILD